MKHTGKGKERKVKFIPAEGSALFAGDRPVHAILKDTKDPRIKKIRKEEGGAEKFRAVQANLPDALFKRLREEAKKNGHSISTQTAILINRHFEQPEGGSSSPLQELVDYVTSNIILAADLILDEADSRQKETTFRAIHHALKTLIEIKKSGGGLTDAKRERLIGVLKDLERMRSIADQEEHRHV